MLNIIIIMKLYQILIYLLLYYSQKCENMLLMQILI